MSKTWASFEERVRDIASYVWGVPCTPARVGGVNIDGVVRLDQEIANFVEITEQRDLGKVRADVIKLETAKGNEGWVYAPNRSHAGRMKDMVEKLNLTDDILWKEISTL